MLLCEAKELQKQRQYNKVLFRLLPCYLCGLGRLAQTCPVTEGGTKGQLAQLVRAPH